MENKTEKNNQSTFKIFAIGPALARLLTIIEGEEYRFKVADYHANIIDMVGDYVFKVGEVNQDCYILTKSQEMHPCFRDAIWLPHHLTDQNTVSICLGLHNYEFRKFQAYQNIVDGNITFYDDKMQQLIRLPHSDIMYGFIDYLIEYKLNNQINDLSSNDISELLDSYIAERCIQKTSRLERKIDI